MIKVDIKDKDIKKVELALEELKKSVHRDVGKLAMCQNILLFSIALKGVKNLDEKRRLLDGAISRFRKYKRTSLAFFRKAVEQEYAKRQAQKPKTFHTLFFPQYRLETL